MQTFASKPAREVSLSAYLIQADVGHVGKVREVGHAWNTASAGHALQSQAGVVCDHLGEQVEDRLFAKGC